MSVQKLRGRVHDDIETGFQRPLRVRRRESVVADGKQPVALADLGHREQIDDFQQRIGRRLDPQQPGIGFDCALQRLQVRQIDERDVVSRGALADVLQDPVAPTVEIVHRDDMRAGVEQLQDRGRGRHAGGESESRRAAFEIGHRRLERIPCGVASARVIVALVNTRARLHVGGGGVDGGHDGPRERVRLLAAVDDAGAEPVSA